MYTRCIYCSAALGRNEAVEEFPVGRTLAFDGEKGRLWAVCGRCGRWNLAPIEERWEAVEALEKRFRDTRIKAQSANIGLAKAPDGTRLVRVGHAVPAELAEWRYGRRFTQRRRLHRVMASGATAASLGMVAAHALGLAGLGLALLPTYYGFQLLNLYHARRQTGAVRVPGPDGFRSVGVRNQDLRESYLAEPLSAGERLSLVVSLEKKVRTLSFHVKQPRYEVRVAEPEALKLLRRGMVFVNAAGATPALLDTALRVRANRPLGDYVCDGGIYGKKLRFSALEGCAPGMLLALEMALHEEDEARALHGELAALETAWREAEEIAAIADALPNVPPPIPPAAPPS